MFLPTPKEMRPGGPLDIETLTGCIRWFFLGWVGFFGVWYVDDLSLWIDSLLGVVTEPLTSGRVRGHRTLVLLMVGVVIVGSFFKGISLYIKERQAKSLAKDDSHDKESVSRESMYEKDDNSDGPGV
ncbi:TPA: hypothetical protein SAN82_002521 [Pseudomonas putida]|nr:hypothetical protein [Pseudomonas putida]